MKNILTIKLSRVCKYSAWLEESFIHLRKLRSNASRHGSCAGKPEGQCDKAHGRGDLVNRSGQYLAIALNVKNVMIVPIEKSIVGADH